MYHRFFRLSLLIAILTAMLGCSGTDEMMQPMDSPSVNAVTTEVDGFAVTLTSDRFRYGIGDDIRLELRIKNVTTNTRTYRSTSTQRYDFRAEGTGVSWRWASGRVFGQTVTDVTIRPGETVTHTATWNQRDDRGAQVPAGRFDTRGMLVGTASHVQSATLPITIE